MDIFWDLMAVFGRLHPMLLHMPIGLLVGLGMMELVGWRRGAAPASRWLLVLATACAVITAASGWMLHEEDGYASSFTLEWHERLGIATAFAALTCCFLRFRGSTKQYRLTLLLTIAFLVPAGHFGAEMTHGKGFLWEPLEQSELPTYVPMVPEKALGAEGAPLLASYDRHIAPLLGARCTRCHGRRKSKAELRLDSPQAILAGGENGPVLGGPGQISDAEETEMYHRLQLPLEHEDHMPPESKTQLTTGEIELLRSWLAAGAPFDEGFDLGEGVALPKPPTEDAHSTEGFVAITDTAADADITHDPQYELDVRALRAELIHVQSIAPGSKQLWVDFSAIADTTDDSKVERLLTPLLSYLSELSLARTRITDKTLELVADMPHLMELDLGQTITTDLGLASLWQHRSLERLVLSQTLISTESSELFGSLPRLTHLWLWGTSFSPGDIAILRLTLPEVTIIAGDSFDAEPLEVEPDLVFTSDAASIDAPSAGVVSLIAVNKTCPVSGKPVDPRYTVVVGDKVIGFCCPNCPKTFWEDPAAYPW